MTCNLALKAREAQERGEIARRDGNDKEAARQFRIEELADELADLLEEDGE